MSLSVPLDPLCRTGNETDDDSIKKDNWRQPKYSFFESPQVLAVLHRTLVALHMVFGQSHDCGIRSIGWFLELSGLDSFIASSYGSQQKVASQVEQWIGQFGQQEDQRLGQQMPNQAMYTTG